jgi:hypothetical protein
MGLRLIKRHNRRTKPYLLLAVAVAAGIVGRTEDAFPINCKNV